MTRAVVRARARPGAMRSGVGSRVSAPAGRKLPVLWKGSPPMPPIVSISGVTKVYHLGKTEVPALRGVTLEVHSGEFVSIAGPSGSGKTTLLNLIGCVDTATTGVVEVSGRDTKQLSERQLTDLRLHTIGFIFQ